MLLNHITNVYNEYFSTLELQQEYNKIFSKSVNIYNKVNEKFVERQNIELQNRGAASQLRKQILIVDDEQFNIEAL